MFNIIDNYMRSISKDDIDKFAKKKNVILAQDELDFTYLFIKKNYKEILKNYKIFDIERYKNKYHGDNFNKIKKVYIEYFSKYQRFL